MDDAAKRAEMQKGANSVLDRRTVQNGNANLLKLVKKGHAVLDVGCGSGSITKGITELTGHEGFVKGIDVSEQLISMAKSKFSDVPNLDFEVADINTFPNGKKYDVITSARVLQWVANPMEILEKMKGLLNEGGCITILDYNHEKIEFQPAVPESVKNFYYAFLHWRTDAGMDNTIADNLPTTFKNLGLKNITVEDQSEVSILGAAAFHEELSIWKKVAETRGNQLVTDNYITEEERLTVIREYQEWMESKATCMKLYLKAVTGYI